MALRPIKNRLKDRVLFFLLSSAVGKPFRFLAKKFDWWKVRKLPHGILVANHNVGVKNTERIIRFVFPGLSGFQVVYPPRGMDADISIINLRKGFREGIYKDFDDFLANLWMYVPMERYEEKGIYLNIWYPSWVHRSVVRLILL